MAALPYMQLYTADYLADTAHLSTIQHGAYLLLLMNYWQRGKSFSAPDERTLNERLATVARMSNEEWNVHREVLAEFFEVTEKEWIHHRVERDLEAVLIRSTKNRSAGIASAAARRANAERSLNARSTKKERTLNHTDTDTDTEADTDTDKKPSRAKRTGGEKVVKHSTDPRHVGCKEAIFTYYRSKNNVDPDWDGAEGKALGMFLNANPEIGPDQVTAMLRNRFLSDVNHGDRPAKWIRGLKSFLGGPVDRFGKPMHQTAAKIDRNSERYTWRQKEQEEMIRRGDLVQ